MADFLYCATDTQVPANETALLLAKHHIIWCPPPGLHAWHVSIYPKGRERIWLVWRTQHSAPVMLGGGRLVTAPRRLFKTDVLWTEKDLPGIKIACRTLGYSVPPSMSVLRLDAPIICTSSKRPSFPQLISCRSGLSDLSPTMASILDSILHIP